MLQNLLRQNESNNPKILLKMHTYLRNLLVYFEHVLHPASGWSDTNAEKRKRKTRRNGALQLSPECYNIRGGSSKKQEKLRRNPAP